MEFYQTLISRNWGFLNQKEQESIREAKIVLAGCGLGSQIAELATRMGFERFVLCDGDTVSTSNLNRQAFTIKDVGVNKAMATATIIHNINPQARVEIVPEFITLETVERLTKGDIIINMVDPDEVMYEINARAKEKDIPVLFPLNVGFSGFLLVFTKKSQALEEIIGGKIYGDEFYVPLLQAVLSQPPQYLERFYQEYGQELTKQPFPQLGVTVYLTSTLTVMTMIKIVLGYKIKTAPYPITYDLFVD
jgi:molybdopterin/thiamine biosynthesis adenylyltransferase